jgi:hypothetical protein
MNRRVAILVLCLNGVEMFPRQGTKAILGLHLFILGRGEKSWKTP